MNSMRKFLDFLARLDEATLPYTLEHNTEDTIMVLVAVEGERWEVEFGPEGEVEVEVFYSAESEIGLEGEEALERLFLDDDLEEDDEDDDFEDDDLEEDDDDLEDDLDEEELEEDYDRDPRH